MESEFDCLACPFFAACRATQESVMCTLFCLDLEFGRSNAFFFVPAQLRGSSSRPGQSMPDEEAT